MLVLAALALVALVGWTADALWKDRYLIAYVNQRSEVSFFRGWADDVCLQVQGRGEQGSLETCLGGSGLQGALRAAKAEGAAVDTIWLLGNDLYHVGDTEGALRKHAYDANARAFVPTTKDFKTKSGDSAQLKI